MTCPRCGAEIREDAGELSRPVKLVSGETIDANCFAAGDIPTNWGAEAA